MNAMLLIIKYTIYIKLIPDKYRLMISNIFGSMGKINYWDPYHDSHNLTPNTHSRHTAVFS